MNFLIGLLSAFIVNLLGFFFRNSEDDPFEDLSRSEWERLDNAINDTIVKNEQTSKCF